MLTIRPEALYLHLEFDKITSLLRDYCQIETTKTEHFPLKLESNKKILDQWLDEVQQCKNTFEQNDLIPIRPCPSISELLVYLDIEDYALVQESLVHLLTVLFNLEELNLYFKKESIEELSPFASNRFKNIQYTSDLYHEFRVVFDDHGQVRPDASPELKAISRTIKSKEYEIDQVFKNLMGEYRKNGWLSESGESIRNHRRVVAVNAEHKRKIRGIVHDESATGKTTYIEPEAIIEKNNELFDLELGYQKEIYRIFKVLSKSCHLQVVMLRIGWTALLHFDFVRAKALFAAKYQGFRPEIKDRAQLKIKAGRHPLLLLKNQMQKKSTIPFDLTLFGENRILILSGPNAGGKSIAMKATVLLQLMLQAGLLIPVHEASEMGIFHSFLGDIGDHQSLEEDLSTYSSRLLLMKQFLECADERSLMCIDEFGSGTDPKLGGAIAEAILLALNKKKVYGVITTHYSNLKILAFKTKGLLNGAMVFDTEHLKPTFQLIIGRPGSSYAFEVAHRSGLNPEVIEHAKNRTQQDQKELEELLIDLQRNKLSMEDQLQRVKTKEDQLDKLIQSYDLLASEVELRKKKIKVDQKAWEINAAKDLAIVVDKTIKELKASTHINPSIKQRYVEKSKINIDALQAEIKILDKEILTLEKHNAKPIMIGSYVRLKNGSEVGQVLSMRKGLAEIIMGSMTINVAMRDLVSVKEQATQPATTKSKALFIEQKSVESSLDLRGMSKAQAIDLLENYLDRAILSNVHELRILHGKGSGILRDLVKSQAKKYKAIKKIFHPPSEAGGDGISIIEL